MSRLRHTPLIALLTLVGLLTLPIWPQPSANVVSADPGIVMPACVNPPSQSVGPERAQNPVFCTPTPGDAPNRLPPNPPHSPPPTPDTPVPTSIPLPTNTPIPTNTPVPPTNTPVPTIAPTPVPSASITVYNTGAFFVQYFVSYNLPTAPQQSQASGVFNINQGVTLTVPGTATNVGVLVQYYTGITGWQTACIRAYGQAVDAVIIVSGTIYSATCAG